MRPLPRVLAITDDAIVDAEDFAIRAAAIAASGPGIGIVVRAPGAAAGRRLHHLDRVRALAKPPGAATIGHHDPAAARIADAQGIQLRTSDLTVSAARKVLGTGWIGISIHETDEARAAQAEGADYVVAGTVFETASHPNRPPRGLGWLAEVVAVGLPVFAIGGVTVERARAVRATGAWGVAAIGALWRAPDSAKAAIAMLAAGDGQ